MQLKDCIALLSVYSASALRRYIPKAEFGGCTVAQTIHNDLRGIYRALGSYTKEDTTKGASTSLSRASPHGLVASRRPFSASHPQAFSMVTNRAKCAGMF